MQPKKTTFSSARETRGGASRSPRKDRFWSCRGELQSSKRSNFSHAHFAWDFPGLGRRHEMREHHLEVFLDVRDFSLSSRTPQGERRKKGDADKPRRRRQCRYCLGTPLPGGQTKATSAKPTLGRFGKDFRRLVPPKRNEISAGKFLRLHCPSLAVDQRDKQKKLVCGRACRGPLPLSQYDERTPYDQCDERR